MYANIFSSVQNCPQSMFPSYLCAENSNITQFLVQQPQKLYFANFCTRNESRYVSDASDVTMYLLSLFSSYTASHFTVFATFSILISSTISTISMMIGASGWYWGGKDCRNIYQVKFSCCYPTEPGGSDVGVAPLAMVEIVMSKWIIFGLQVH